MAALVLVAVAGALAAAITRLAATEATLVARQRTVARALVLADACTAELVAALPAGWELEPLLAGADGHLGTDDDGTLPAPPACQTATSMASPGGRLVVHVAADVPRGRRRVDALVARDPRPFDEALVWLADAHGLGPVFGAIEWQGPADASAEPVASLASASDPEALDAWLARHAASIAVGPRVAPPRHAPPPPLAELDARVRAVTPPGTGTLVAEGIPPVALTFAAGDLSVGATAIGAGLLFVAGRLDIEGALAFTGVVVARGGVRVASGGSLFIEGALWLDGRPAGPPALDVAGTLVLRAAAEALDLADGTLPLPRLARIVGIRDPA